MKVKTLVTDAMYLSGHDREFQKSITGAINDLSIRLLNDILDESRDIVPYPEQIVFTDYDNLSNTKFVSIDTVDYMLGKTRIPLTRYSLKRFDELEGVEDLKGTPEGYYFDQLSQSIKVYPAPSQSSYKFEVDGRLAMDGLGINDDMPPNVPNFMISWLRYELASRLCDETNVAWSTKKEATRQKLEQALRNKLYVDLRPARNKVFSNNRKRGQFPWLYWMSK